MTDDEKQATAIAAASQAADATAELLRYAREGEGLAATFEGYPVEQLLDAAKLAIEIEGEDRDHDRNQLYGAIVRHLEGWA